MCSLQVGNKEQKNDMFLFEPTKLALLHYFAFFALLILQLGIVLPGNSGSPTLPKSWLRNDTWTASAAFPFSWNCSWEGMMCFHLCLIFPYRVAPPLIFVKFEEFLHCGWWPHIFPVICSLHIECLTLIKYLLCLMTLFLLCHYLTGQYPFYCETFVLLLALGCSS